MHYKIVRAKKGGIRYMRNGKWAAKADIRPDVLEQLETRDEFNDERHFCVFCGRPATNKRYIHPQLVDLCEDDYYSKRMGEVAQKLREVQDAEEKAPEKSEENQDNKNDDERNATQENAS